VAIYLETSPLLSWLFNQDTAQIVKATLQSGETLVTSSLTRIETIRAILRATALNKVTREQSDSLVQGANHILSACIIKRISTAVEKQASKAFPIEPIRSLDAIHLATATIFLAAYPDLKILSFDLRVINNAKALGFELHNEAR
jgi:predicted nucleic acid-binding protein